MTIAAPAWPGQRNLIGNFGAASIRRVLPCPLRHAAERWFSINGEDTIPGHHECRMFTGAPARAGR
jgi:hypothetical protein